MTQPDTPETEPDTPDAFRNRLFFWLIVAVSVSITVVAGTVTGLGPPIAATTGVLVALGTVGWYLWRASPDPVQARSTLGTGLLGSIVVAAAVGSAQFAIDERRRHVERTRAQAAQQVADRQSLRITVGLQNRLAGIDLSARDLTKFYFADKELKKADFHSATLMAANFEHASLGDASLVDANLRRAVLDKADLQGANLREADLRGATFNSARLQNADLTKADLRHAELTHAALSDATLIQANLSQADLTLANLRRANLRGADLRGVKLYETKFRDANFDLRTRWPANFEPRAEGALGP